MTKAALIACVIMAAGGPACAQQTVRLLTPTTDTCRAFTAAMVAPDKTALTGLAGWVVGYLSGVAQGMQSDFLHNEDVAKLTNQLYGDCLKRPEMPLSTAAQELVKRLILANRVH